MYSNFLSEIDDKQIFKNQTDTPLPIWYLIEGYNNHIAIKGSAQKAILLPVSGSRLKHAIINLPADNKRALMEQYEKDVYHAKRQQYLKDKIAEQAAVQKRLYPNYDKTLRHFDYAVGVICLLLILFFVLFVNDENLSWYLNFFK